MWWAWEFENNYVGSGARMNSHFVESNSVESGAREISSRNLWNLKKVILVHKNLYKTQKY
jgi:hypothetical protein